MQPPDLIERLVNALRCLPGVGPKSARRMCYHLLERQRDAGRELAAALLAAMDGVRNCERCRTLSESAVCRICASTRRDGSQLCVVETPSDVSAMEHGSGYGGLYFVLMGRLSPLDGIGPAEIGLELLEQRLAEGEVSELILATSYTPEGEATAHYVGEMARERALRVTRIAHGIPVGGELEYVDAGTLAFALRGRRELGD